jgi:hypothetical protein
MKAPLNTELFSLIRVGMYCSELSPDEMFSDYQINSDHEEGYANYDSEYFNNNFQFSLYQKKIEKLATDFLNQEWENDGIKIKIKAGELYSPRFYNFSTDQIETEVTYNKPQLLKYAKENSVEFDEFLHKRYSSYDGFSSFTANNYSQWLDDYRENNVQSIGAILTYVFHDIFEETQAAFIEHCNTELNHSEFVDCTMLDAEELAITNYVRENYDNFDIEDLRETYDFEYLSEATVERIANELIAGIENHTLNLFDNLNN